MGGFSIEILEAQKLSHPFFTPISVLSSFLCRGGDLPTSWNTVVQTDDAVARMENAIKRTWQMFQNILSMDFSPDLLHKQDCGQKRRECFAHVISVADLFQSVRWGYSMQSNDDPFI